MRGNRPIKGQVRHRECTGQDPSAAKSTKRAEGKSTSQRGE